MRIGVISDTHIHKHPEKILQFLKTYLNDVDMIIHAGDYTDIKVVNILKEYKRFLGVWGNNDNNAIRQELREKEIIKIEGYRIGIYHGHGEEKNTMERAYEFFKDDKVDIIIFGHSHQPLIMTKNKTLMLNPGSPTYKRKGPWYSYILLQLDERGIGAEIKFLSKSKK